MYPRCNATAYPRLHGFGGCACLEKPRATLVVENDIEAHDFEAAPMPSGCTSARARCRARIRPVPMQRRSEIMPNSMRTPRSEAGRYTRGTQPMPQRLATPWAAAVSMIERPQLLAHCGISRSAAHREPARLLLAMVALVTAMVTNQLCVLSGAARSGWAHPFEFHFSSVSSLPEPYALDISRRCCSAGCKQTNNSISKQTHGRRRRSLPVSARPHCGSRHDGRSAQ